MFALDDDYSLGVLSSAAHRVWFEARCSTLETRLRYTPTTVWDSFPWPQNPTTALVSEVAEIASAILAERQVSLNAGQPLKRQYDALRQPGRSRLRDLHAAVDDAVLRAYAFAPASDVITQLLALNQAVAADPEAHLRLGQPRDAQRLHQPLHAPGGDASR